MNANASHSGFKTVAEQANGLRRLRTKGTAAAVSYACFLIGQSVQVRRELQERNELARAISGQVAE